MNVVEVQNLHKSYGNRHVLKGIHFEAHAGEIIGVIGKNGAGKSTFLEIIMTLKSFDQGKVRLFGKNIEEAHGAALDELRRNISAVLQPTQFYKSLKVEELLRLFKAYYQSDVSIEQMIADFSLASHRKTYFEKLSGGWKQKVSLAIAFLSKPKLLILDEPTTGLDPHMRQTLWAYIQHYNQKAGGTVILTTHSMDEVERFCDKVMLIENGRTKQFDTVRRIIASGYQSMNDYYLQNVPSSEESVS
ncbi:ABC transporter ATP-binding protein [Domibacillus indicus]|uniref:ABC transporter ATP-binding protein n=1 Tax=Domibacillus indicus TaxID=1437523 RepID=UPI000617E77D|nr:ABC transporter ATP-binding protein [Domibacillus indicus]